jgi:hypothetical protein
LQATACHPRKKKLFLLTERFFNPENATTIDEFPTR